MTDDLGWSLDPFFGFLLGALLFSDRGRQGDEGQGHQHGYHWHAHVLPAGRHVHDGGLNGPIRIVPPTAEELEEQARRRARTRDVWALTGAIVGALLLFAGSVWWGLGILAGSALLSPSIRVESGPRAPSSERDGAGMVQQRPFVVSRVDVFGDDRGRTIIQLDGWAQWSARQVDVCAVVYSGPLRVGYAEARVHDLVVGQPVAVTLRGRSRYSGHDRVEVDSWEVSLC